DPVASDKPGVRDLNGDGHLDAALQIFGDVDNDGVFDPYDDCRETPNTDQLDSDVDGLGDACDPAPACAPVTLARPTVAPAGTADWQKAIGAAARELLKVQVGAVRSCLDRIAAGKLTGDPTVVCRGSVSGGVTTFPADATTLDKIVAANTKFQAGVAKKCAPGMLAQLDACGSTPAALATCVPARIRAAASAFTTLLYGDVAPIADKKVLACQKAIGKAGGTVLASFVLPTEACLDAIDTGKLSGDPREQCLGAGTGTDEVPPADAKTAAGLDKATLKAAEKIASKCPTVALAPLGLCAGADASGMADCIRCGAFGQMAGLVRATYGPP